MTNQNQPPSQKFEKAKFEGGHDDLNNLSSSSSSSSSLPSLTPYQVLENPAEFFCPATAKEKNRAVKFEALIF
jgi:hypothetical protein